MTGSVVVHVLEASPRGELDEETATPLTRNFNDLVKSRVDADPAFRQALFQQAAVQTMLDGDVATAKFALRDYINATIGFERLSLATQTPAKSLTWQPDGGKSACCKSKPACISK